jgi:hypothetical protein
MKLFFRCTILAVGLVATSIAATILCLAKACGAAAIPLLKIASLLAWPGFVLMSFVFHGLAVVLVDSLFAYAASQVPAILINISIYATFFFVLAKLGQAVVTRRTLRQERTTRPEITTDGKIRGNEN